jgi:DNA-binding response OmpR family regulator
MPNKSADKPVVLVVEDEVLIAMDIQAQLEDAGWDVLGPAGTVLQAQALLSQSIPGFAVLDINLGKDTSFPVADLLAQSGVPFLFLSGASTDILPERFKSRQMLQKPISFDELTFAMQDAVG